MSFDLQGQGEQAENHEPGGNGAPAESTSSDATAVDEINIDLAALTNGDVSTSGVDIRV